MFFFYFLWLRTIYICIVFEKENIKDKYVMWVSKDEKTTQTSKEFFNGMAK